MSRIAIIGAGWYGCHIALSLRAAGHEISVFERHGRPLHEASGNNQFRLHLGFHYARHAQTRLQSRDGFMRFQERYPDLSEPVPRNVYAVAETESWLDLPTYRLIMQASSIPFQDIPTPTGLHQVSGCVQVSERVLLIDRARRWFAAALGPALRLGEGAEHVAETACGVRVNGQAFDVLVDATWGRRLPQPGTRFEPTILLYFEPAELRGEALTLVDGPLCSIYPTEYPRVVTLSSVPHSPIAMSHHAAAARARLDRVDTAEIEAKRSAMVSQIARYMPDFPERFRFLGPQLAIKTKPAGLHDDRSCSVVRRGRSFLVMSGKIDTIFVAADTILAALDGERIDPTPSRTLRLEIGPSPQSVLA